MTGPRGRARRLRPAEAHPQRRATHGKRLSPGSGRSGLVTDDLQTVTALRIAPGREHRSPLALVVGVRDVVLVVRMQPRNLDGDVRLDAPAGGGDAVPLARARAAYPRLTEPMDIAAPRVVRA